MNIEVLNPFEDTIIVYDQEDVLQQAGIGLDQEGECQITMTFNDGKAVAVEDEHLTMVYPTIEDVRKSEQMQSEIIAYTGRDDINQFDVALKYGKLQYV